MIGDEDPKEIMFQEAVNALRRGDKPRAKEHLSLLLKEDKNNSTYWVWLSAAVDNPKERIYCLQTALKLDPENTTAKRGLILLGALAPDESVQPFVMNRPRAWEQKLLFAQEKQKEKGLKGLTNHPATRLAGIVVIGLGIISVVMFGFILPRQSTVRPTQTNTPGPSPTFTTTPTLYGVTAAPTESVSNSGPTPLWALLSQTYTPTALYVNTPRAPQTKDQYRSAAAAYARGDWDAYIENMKLIAPLEPASADIPYLIGDAYRFKGDANNALNAYNDALKIDPNFGAAYLGLARARLMGDPNANVTALFDEAIARDPNFGEIYLERARYYLHINDSESAIADLSRANQLMPESPEVYVAYANAYLIIGDKENALISAEKAYSLDITNLDVYKTLGALHIESGQYQRAIEELNVYTAYVTSNDQVYALLGRAYFELKDYKSATQNFDRASAINRNGLRNFYLYKGLANLELNNLDQALGDLEDAFNADETSFEVNVGLLRVYFLQGKFGSAFLKAEALKSLADTDQETAEALYWHALVQEQRSEMNGAIKDWQDLLALSKDATTPEMRAEAEQHLKSFTTPTNTPKGSTATPKPKTPTPSKTPSPTPTK